MPKPLTKEELGTVIDKHLTEQLTLRKAEITDEVKGVMKEMIEESLKDVKSPVGELPPREDPKGGFTCFAEFAKEVFDAGEGMTNPSDKLKAWNTKSLTLEKTAGSPSQTVGSLQSGGALIPPEFSRTALTRAKERSNILGRARIIPMTSPVIQIPYIKDFDNSQGKVAGNVKFRWVSENAAATGSEVQFEMIELRLKEANCMVYVSKRLMDFSPVSIEPFITTAVDEALDLGLSDAFLNSGGAGRPNSVLGSPALVSISKETNQYADTILYENTLNMLARFYGNNGAWFASRTIIPQLGVMNVAVGTGGSAVFLAGSNGIAGATGAFPATLHGAPIYYDQVCPILGDVGDLSFIDWSQYLVGQWSGGAGLQMTDSAHLKFDYRQHAFQFTMYIDGQPWWPKPFAPLKGDTLSPYVTIEARA